MEGTKKTATIKKETEKPLDTTEADAEGKLPKRPSLAEKLLVRVIIVILILILVGVFLFWYWYLKKESPLPLEETASTSTEETVPGSTEIETLSLLSFEKTESLEISQLQELPTALDQLSRQEYEENKLTRITIKNLKNNKWVNLKEFLQAFQIEAPENIYLETEDFNLFLYSQSTGSRIGIITKTKEKDLLKTTLDSWEEAIEENFDNLFSLMGKEKPATISYFKNANYKDLSFRYQTFAENDLGFCYLISDNFFVITSSYESMEKIINKLYE